MSSYILVDDKVIVIENRQKIFQLQLQLSTFLDYKYKNFGLQFQLQLQQNRVINYNFINYNYNFSKPGTGTKAISSLASKIDLCRSNLGIFRGQNIFLL